MISGKSKQKSNNTRSRYLQYDDVFLDKSSSGYNNRQNYQQPRRREEYRSNNLANFKQPKKFVEEDNFETYDDNFDVYDENNEHDYYPPQQDNYDLPRADEKLSSYSPQRQQQYNGQPQQPPRQPQYNSQPMHSNYGMNQAPRPQQRRQVIQEPEIHYKKRNLPQLQRFPAFSNEKKDFYSDYSAPNSSYWDEDEDEKRRYGSPNSEILKSLWNKFLLTFTSIISVVCLCWIAYNWNSSDKERSSSVKTQENGRTLIMSESNDFKVLPDDPGGLQIPHQDKTIYEKISRTENKQQYNSASSLMPPEETPTYHGSSSPIEEVSIIDEKVYYIKIGEADSKVPLVTKLKELKTKYKNKIDGYDTSIKSVKNSEGKKSRAILIGPIDSKDMAMELAQDINIDCSIVAARE